MTTINSFPIGPELSIYTIKTTKKTETLIKRVFHFILDNSVSMGGNTGIAKNCYASLLDGSTSYLYGYAYLISLTDATPMNIVSFDVFAWIFQ